MDQLSSRQDKFARSVLLTALYAGSAFICLHECGITDPDIWWHLRTGQWILQHGGVPHADPFSVLGAAKPWEAYSWLFELLVLKLFQHWDLVGILAYTTGMVLAITAAVYHLVKRLQPDFTLAVLLTMGTMACLAPLYTPRPWLFTILFFVLEMDVLMNFRKTGKSRELLWLPLIFALWVNIHIQFVNGLMVLGVAALEPVVARWWPERSHHAGSVRLWGISAVCILATLLNPYGWGIYKTAWDLASQPGVLNSIVELQAMPFRDVGNYAVLFLALAAVGALAWNRRLPFFELSLLAFAAVLSFRSLRDIWVMIVVEIAVLSSNLSGDEEDRQRRLPVFAFPFVAVAVALLVFLGAAVLNLNNSRLHELLAKEMPVRAVEFVKAHKFSGPLYNTYDWGGFLIWNLPSLPVSMDGRAALYGDERIDRSLATLSARPDWASDPLLASAHLVIGPVKAPLTQVLRLDRRFELVFEDKVAAVFVAPHVGHESVSGH
jgi:hypothetical protein